jgi:hypothetical protein
MVGDEYIVSPVTLHDSYYTVVIDKNGYKIFI